MAGRLTIQRFPKGLIELLGMRATGDTPTELQQYIAGNLDLLDMYLLDRMQHRIISTGVAIPALGYQTFGTSSGPAAGYVWFVYDIGVQYGPVAAAATLQSALGISRAQNNSTPLPGGSTGLLAAGGVATVAIHFERPLIMRPGDIIAHNTSVYTGAPAVTPSGSMYYAEIGI